jgi:hypothetical protein
LFEHFSSDDEKCVWALAQEDFELLGYERFNCELPESSNNCLHLTTDSAAVSLR